MTVTRQNLLRQFLEHPPELEGGLSVTLQPISDRRARLKIADRDHSYEAIAGGLSVPYPSGLKRLLASDPDVEVALVDRAAPGLDRAAMEQDVGYLDLRGRGRLVGPGFVYVAPPSASGRASGGADDDTLRGPRSRPRGRVSPFAPKASRVVRALLSQPEREWRLSELAELCGMNPGNVHRVLGALVRQDLIEREDRGYVVPDPGSLLEAWAEQGRRANSEERIWIPIQDSLSDAVADLLSAPGTRGVVSGELAAELYAPHLAATTAILHRIDDGVLSHPELLGAGVLPSLRAPNRIVVRRADDGVSDFSELRGDLAVVSPPQLYFDLYRDRGRAREAAEHVRREVLSY